MHAISVHNVVPVGSLVKEIDLLVLVPTLPLILDVITVVDYICILVGRNPTASRELRLGVF